MKTDLEYINCKLDHLTTELVIIKESLKGLNTHSPPLSLPEAAAFLHLSRSRVYYLVNTGQLKPLQHRKGRRILFSKESLIHYMYEGKIS
jgi:predicted DNA-binding transcriptional regulator AlpA